MAAEFLNIPLNLKQKHSVFVIDPNNKLHSEKVDKTGAGASAMSTQMFSFKSNIASANNATNGNKAQISICPRSFINSFANDISYKLLYEYTKQDNQYINLRTSIDDLFNEIPAIQIRQYSLNARINQAMSLFSSLADGFNSGLADSDNGSSIATKLQALWYTFIDLIGCYDENSPQKHKNIHGSSPVKSFADVFTNAFNDLSNINNRFSSIISNFDSGDREYASVYTIPWTMYYAMITSFSSNIYEFPFNGQFKFGANGTSGWNNAGITGAQFGSSSTFFSFINQYLKNVKLDFTPTWDGSAESTQSISLTVDLFNDNVDSAINNFILVNTLIPSAMSMQYNVFQNSPDLYDIKIKGLDRLFMCSGNFECEYKGVVRRPSLQFFTKLESHLHPLYNGSMQTFIDNDIIRIPDIYSLTLNFNSLMPNNFNNYIYKYCMNNKIEQITGTNMVSKSDGLSAIDKIWKSITDKYNEHEKGLGVTPTKLDNLNPAEAAIKELTSEAKEYVEKTPSLNGLTMPLSPQQ